MILNGKVKVVQADIVALDGIIHVIDAVLIPPEGDETSDDNTDQATFESSPGLATVQDDTVSDSIEIDDPRYLRDLSVTLDITHPFVFDLVITLEHEETGTVVTLVEKPRSDNQDIKTTLTDSAELGQDDVAYDPEADIEAFPEAEYRPLEPLEFFYGEALAGTWTLSIRDDVDTSETGTLNAWALTFSATDERPDPAIYLVPGGSNITTLVPGTTEALVFNVKRLADLEGPIELSVDGSDGLSAEPVMIAADAEQGVLPVTVSEGAELGKRTLEVTARSGDATRSVTLDLMLAPFDQHDVDLLAYLPLATIGAPDGDDSWGWSDPETGSNIAMMGMTTGVAFVDVSDPRNPEYLGLLPTHSPEDETGNIWRDIKVYQNYAYVVSEAEDHGMQILDLTQLRTVSAPQTFSETAHYDGFGNAHNIVIDEETGYAYSVGATDESYEQTCFGGLLMMDLSTPTDPEFAVALRAAYRRASRQARRTPTTFTSTTLSALSTEAPTRTTKAERSASPRTDRSTRRAPITWGLPT